jgi:two-component system chemotaxis response regulator CheB
MVKAMSQVKVVRRWPSRREHRVRRRAPKRGPAAPVRLVAIAASTGGPAVLQRVLGDLPGDFPAPIVVVQHIANGFVAGLADWLDAACDLRVKVAEHGEELRPRTVYLAPEGRHVEVDAPGRVRLTSEAPVGGFRPSGTPLFMSAARAYGPAVAAVVLTGMGSDGVEGLKAVKDAAGYVLAQNEASSVVYGMPGSAVEAGLADEVLAVEELGRRLGALAVGRGDA